MENVEIAAKIPSFCMHAVYTSSELNKIFIFIFIGTFDKDVPPKQQLEEAQALLDVSVKSKKLPSDYILVAHRQVSQTKSPGEALFKILKTWPHWKDCYMETC
jgi:N-acetylmuramoyl-L-alanine amidase